MQEHLVCELGKACFRCRVRGGRRGRGHGGRPIALDRRYFVVTGAPSAVAGILEVVAGGVMGGCSQRPSQYGNREGFSANVHERGADGRGSCGSWASTIIPYALEAVRGIRVDML